MTFKLSVVYWLLEILIVKPGTIEFLSGTNPKKNRKEMQKKYVTSSLQGSLAEPVTEISGIQARSTDNGTIGLLKSMGC